ncbi:transglycosylase SLT domain-containing protein [Methylobacterium sp. J-076]|uniref:transglycosylase SLT domain-containing protein n=1 Tax=Methylobacterium sp. J-076 TaxID=2836655 RepID=UPI001FBBD0CE|nr:transglycosylase SLT domain-containing protein [Methylobacterium sp. J-076]MCJ2011730.1 lytic transglycosylase domain-containing protein [Methylobacterium sp. J-076]
MSVGDIASVRQSTLPSELSTGGGQEDLGTLFSKLLTDLGQMMSSSSNKDGLSEKILMDIGQILKAAPHHEGGSAASTQGQPASQGSAGSNGSAGSAGGSGSSGSAGGGAAGGGATAEMPANLQEIWNQHGATIKKYVDEANANGAHLTYQFVAAELMKESSGDAKAVGDGGTSLGIAQINDQDAAFTTGKFAGQDRMNPEIGIGMMVQDLAGYSQQYGNDLRAVADAYETGGNPNSPYLEGGRDYGEIVLSLMQGGN